MADCILCEGKCRGHSLGASEQWDPEPCSEAWVNGGTARDLRIQVQAYLEQQQDIGLESDGFLTGMDVTYPQAKEVLWDFVKAVEAGVS